MAEYFRHEIAKWNVATDDLTLEQEAAYHRVVSQIRLYERPFRENYRVLAGLWRCNERKAKRILSELVEAGKLSVEGGYIIDEKAVNDASTLNQLRIDRRLAGSRGGVKSGKVRAKALKSNEADEASASTQLGYAKLDKNPPNPPGVLFADFWQVWPSKEGKAAAEKAWKKLSPDDRATALARVGPWFSAWRAKHPDASPIHASTFLNQRRWEDEGAPAIRSGDKYEIAASSIKTGKPFLCKNISAAFARELIGRGFVSDSECRKVGVI